MIDHTKNITGLAYSILQMYESRRRKKKFSTKDRLYWFWFLWALASFFSLPLQVKPDSAITNRTLLYINLKMTKRTLARHGCHVRHHLLSSLENNNPERLQHVLDQEPKVRTFLKPIAAPAAMGLAGFSCSTFITATYVARWWGGDRSPGIFFPFVAISGGVGQFIAGLFGYPARDTLVTVVHVLWGSFWIGIGLLFMLTATGSIPPHRFHDHYPEIASWMVVLAFFTWSCALASSARDLILCGILTTLATGATIACCLFAYGSGVRTGMKVAAYFWIISAILGWWRVTVYLIEEAFGQHPFTRVFPIFRTKTEKNRPLLAPGLGMPGVV